MAVVFVLYSVLPENNKGPAVWSKHEDYNREGEFSAFTFCVEVVGWMAAVVCIVLNIHPMVVLREVIRTNNVSLMGSQTMQWATLEVCFVWWLNCLLYIPSTQIFVENSIGIVANVVALLVRFNIWYHGYEVIDDVPKVEVASPVNEKQIFRL